MSAFAEEEDEDAQDAQANPQDPEQEGGEMWRVRSISSGFAARGGQPPAPLDEEVAT